MFTIQDGRESFYQWDIDRKLVVKDSTIEQVHFCNKTDDCSLVCETYLEDGVTVVDVPNVLLTTDWKIRVYAYDKNYTKYCSTFGVVTRSKPSDYVYTETEVLNYNDLEKRIAAVEDLGFITQEHLDALNYVDDEELTEALEIVVDTITNLGYVNQEHLDALNYVNDEELEEALEVVVNTVTGLGYTTAADVKAIVDNELGVIENGTY